MNTVHETLIFQDRVDGGRQLASKLLDYRADRPLVLALPRGGVVVGFEVADALNAPLHVFVSHKLCVPGHPEIGIGAIAPGDVQVIDEDAISWLRVSSSRLQRIVADGKAELERRLSLYHTGFPALNVRDRTVIVVDDGLATGMTAYAALLSLRQQKPARVILAAPVCAKQTAEMMSGDVYHLVCASIPDHFRAVGFWYRDFEPVTDEQVFALLERNRRDLRGAA